MPTVSPATPAITWFEIPCADLARAQRFYEAVLARPMQREDLGGGPMALFAHAAEATTGGALCTGPAHRVARIAPAGGQVLDACIELPRGIGVIAHMVDADGNHIGLHAATR